MIILGECMTVHSGSRKYLNTYRRKLLRIIMYVCASVKHFEIETRFVVIILIKFPTNPKTYVRDIYRKYVFSKKLLHGMSRYPRHVISVKNSATLL